ncbi:hypothetical protein JB92DRAFT_736181 [Gautieria morchelliformis]|nr:hypothetical protein JB92DRAFT_736181 [Gautieria morchelliformis]
MPKCRYPTFSKERRHAQLDEAYKGRSAPASMASMSILTHVTTCDVTDARPHTQPRHPARSTAHTMSYASGRCTSPVPPNFHPAEDRALDLFDPMPERAMASLGAAVPCTHDVSLTYLPAYPAPYGQASRTSFPAPDSRRPSPGPRGFALLPPRTYCCSLC